MANLLDSMYSSASALGVYDRVLSVAQSNVANSSTPGWVKQSQSLVSLPFDLSLGAMGGVRAGEVVGARSEYAEQAVRRQAILQGQDQQNVNSLNSLQSLFDVSGQSGIPNALNNLLQSFSNWAQSPTDSNARLTVIERATSLAQAFNQAAAGLDNFRLDTEQQLGDTVNEVNRLVGKLQSYNKLIMVGNQDDAGLDAQAHATLEDLSRYIDFTTSRASDGSFSIQLNGQTPLLQEDRQYQLSYVLVQPTVPPPVYTNPTPPAHARLLASNGADITAATTGGQLGALLNLRNRLLPSYLGDAYQAGDLNRMAKLFADRVNQALTSGNVRDATTDGTDEGTFPAVKGLPLFIYDTGTVSDTGESTGNETNIARTLAINGAITQDKLAAISPGPPEVANGVPLGLAALANPQSSTDEIDNHSFAEFYGNMAARVGRELNDANDNLQLHQATTAQARNLRQQQSGVSLDEEAAILIQFQKAYEANSRLISVLSQLTEDLINILRV